MLSLDLFKSKFETQLHEGAVDSIAEQDQDQPQEKIPTNINQFNTDDNRALVKRIWAQISQHAINDTAGWLTLEWPNQPAATLSRNQVWTVINKIAKMPATQRNAFALSTLGDRNAFLTWMNGLKIIPRPAPKKEPARGQQSLDLKELDQKKSSEDPKFKSTRLDRLKTQARARHPAAASDTEAMIADFVDQQDRDQTEFNRVKNVNRRQDELLKQITDLNQAQDQEIDDLEGEEARLQQNVKQIQAANAALAQKLVAMSQRRTQAEPASEPQPQQPQVGVSVATDKVPAIPAPVATPAIDPRARRYAQQLRKQLNQLQTVVALKAPEDQSQLKQDIDALKSQLAKLQQNEPVATATPATIGGQSADIMPARASSDNETDDGVIDLTGVDDVLAQFRKPAKKSAKKKSKKEPEFELNEGDTIPLKSVVQGYTVEYNPRTRQVTVSRGGQVIGSGINKANNPKHHLTLINRIIDRAEEDKYPADIDVRDVRLPMKKVAEALPAKALEKLYRWKNTQNQPAVKPEIKSAESQPVPARLSDLQSKHQKVANLADIKKDIEILQARATRGGRMLPRGLAADLEDYFTTTDIDTAYDDMMARYQKQLGALQQYLGMRKALWSPKKDIHEGSHPREYTGEELDRMVAFLAQQMGASAKEIRRMYVDPMLQRGEIKLVDKKSMRAKELEEARQETWTAYFTDGTKVTVTNVNDETDPARVRAFFAKKGKTVERFDYGFKTGSNVSKPEPHEPGSGTARSARTGEELPEGKLDRSGQKMYTAKEVYMLTHNGQEVAFYTLKDLKRAEQDAQEMQRKLGGEVHLRKVVREGRAGYNVMNTEKDWHEIERYLSSMINNQSLDPETKKAYQQRYLEKRREAQQKGWAK